MKKFLVGALTIFILTVGIGFSQTAEGDLDLAGEYGTNAYKGGHKDPGALHL